VPYSAQESYRIIWHDCFMSCANCFDATLLMWHGDHQRGAMGTCRLHASCRCIWHDSFINRTIKKNRFEKKWSDSFLSNINKKDKIQKKILGATMLGWAVTLRLRWQLTTQSSTIRSTARTNLRLTCGPHLTFQAWQGAHGCDESAQQNSPNFIAFRLRHDHDIMVRTLVQFHQCRRTG
jgi:hypothetical protein